MKKNAFFVFISMIFGVMTSYADTKTTGEANLNWVDITDDVQVNPINQGGWTVDKAAKVYRNEDGLKLKVTTSNFGNMVVDLKNQKLFKLNTDNSQVEIESSSWIQRDFGMTLVLKAKDFKLRAKMKEKVEGMKSIPGIKAM